MTGGSRHTIKVNRAPVLTLWAAVVGERLGFTPDEALTLGRAVAGLNAYAKGVSLGLIHPAPEAVHEQRKKLQKGKTLTVALLGRAVPVVRTPDGLRALTKDKPDDPVAVTRYLEGKFGEALPEVRTAMVKLARSFTPKVFATRAYSLYETPVDRTASSGRSRATSVRVLPGWAVSCLPAWGTGAISGYPCHEVLRQKNRDGGLRHIAAKITDPSATGPWGSPLVEPLSRNPLGGQQSGSVGTCAVTPCFYS